MRGYYARLASEYDDRWLSYIEATTRETIARLAVRSGDKILDVGCGTAALLHRLASSHPAAKLFGIDPVREMLEIARRRLPSGVLSQGSVEHLPYAERAFDLVVSCNMFHYLPDPIGALEEAKRVLRPGGTLVITDWCADFLVCRVCEWYLSIFRRVRYRVYRQRECISLLGRAGFTVSAAERYKISPLWGVMTATARKR